MSMGIVGEALFKAILLGVEFAPGARSVVLTVLLLGGLLDLDNGDFRDDW